SGRAITTGSPEQLRKRDREIVGGFVMSYDHRGVRNSMAYVIDNFWPGILGKIVGLRDSLFPMLGADAREKLGDSFDTLQSIYVSIIDEDYVLAEDRILFKEQAMRMEDVFKRLLQGYMLQNG